jgi:hypothetical protein
MLCTRCFGRRHISKRLLGLLCSVPCPCCAQTGLVGEDGPTFEERGTAARIITNPLAPTAVGMPLVCVQEVADAAL